LPRLENQTVASGGENIAIRPYGVGVDCHSKFIAVCVLISGIEVKRFEQNFATSIPQLVAAREWVHQVLFENNVDEPVFQWVIESTGCYHFPVVRVFGGRPAIVNPTLAGPTRRKTDTLDARLLAYHSMTGFWPASFFPKAEFHEIRVMALRRRQLMRERNRISNQINNIILRFGHTCGSHGKVTDAHYRPLIEDMCNLGTTIEDPYLSPTGIPPYVGKAIVEMFLDWDIVARRVREQEKTFREAIEAQKWETMKGELDGKEMMKLLLSVPGVGPVTAMSWLAETITPRRFATSPLTLT